MLQQPCCSFSARLRAGCHGYILAAVLVWVVTLLPHCCSFLYLCHNKRSFAYLLPWLQDNFVEMGGVQTLTALLHSVNNRLVYLAAAALAYIVSDTEENKERVINDHG